MTDIADPAAPALDVRITEEMVEVGARAKYEYHRNLAGMPLHWPDWADLGQDAEDDRAETRVILTAALAHLPPASPSPVGGGKEDALAELRRLSEAATPGPWFGLDDKGLIGHRTVWSMVKRVQTFIADFGDAREWPPCADDEAFTVAAVNFVRDLLAAPPPPAPVGSRFPVQPLPMPPYEFQKPENGGGSVVFNKSPAPVGEGLRERVEDRDVDPEQRWHDEALALRDFNIALLARVEKAEAEVATLRGEVERLTQERDEAHRTIKIGNDFAFAAYKRDLAKRDNDLMDEMEADELRADRDRLAARVEVLTKAGRVVLGSVGANRELVATEALRRLKVALLTPSHTPKTEETVSHDSGTEAEAGGHDR